MPCTQVPVSLTYCSFCQVNRQLTAERTAHWSAESSGCPYLFWAPSWVGTQSTDFGGDRTSQCSISETHRCAHLPRKWSPAWHQHQSLFVYQPLKLPSPKSFYLDRSVPCCKYKQTICEAWILVTCTSMRHSSSCVRQEHRNTMKKHSSWWKILQHGCFLLPKGSAQSWKQSYHLQGPSTTHSSCSWSSSRNHCQKALPRLWDSNCSPAVSLMLSFPYHVSSGYILKQSMIFESWVQNRKLLQSWLLLFIRKWNAWKTEPNVDMKCIDLGSASNQKFLQASLKITEAKKPNHMESIFLRKRSKEAADQSTEDRRDLWVKIKIISIILLTTGSVQTVTQTLLVCGQPCPQCTFRSTGEAEKRRENQKHWRVWEKGINYTAVSLLLTLELVWA